MKLFANVLAKMSEQGIVLKMADVYSALLGLAFRCRQSTAKTQVEKQDARDYPRVRFSRSTASNTTPLSQSNLAPSALSVITIQLTEGMVAGAEILAILAALYVCVAVVQACRRWYAVHYTNPWNSAWRYFLNAVYLSLSPDICLLLIPVHVALTVFLKYPLPIVGIVVLYLQWYYGTWYTLYGKNRKAVVWYLTAAPVGIALFWRSPLNFRLNYHFLLFHWQQLVASCSEAATWLFSQFGGGSGGGTIMCAVGLLCATGAVCNGSCGVGAPKPFLTVVRNTVDYWAGPDMAEWVAAHPTFVGAVMGAGAGALLHNRLSSVFPAAPGSLARPLPPALQAFVATPIAARLTPVWAAPSRLLSTHDPRVGVLPATALEHEATLRAELRAERAEFQAQQAEQRRLMAAEALAKEVLETSPGLDAPKSSYARMLKDSASRLVHKPGMLGFIAVGAVVGLAGAEVVLVPPKPSK